SSRTKLHPTLEPTHNLALANRLCCSLNQLVLARMTVATPRFLDFSEDLLIRILGAIVHMPHLKVSGLFYLLMIHVDIGSIRSTCIIGGRLYINVSEICAFQN